MAMGFVKKEKMLMTDDGKPYTFIGKNNTYRVVKESNNMTAIYLYNYGENRLITSKPKWSQAIKLANLLIQAYEEGYEQAKDLYNEEYNY